MTTKNGKQRMRAPVATSPCASAGSCPDCGAGELFLDVHKSGAIEMLCDLCTAYEPVSGELPVRAAADVPSALVFRRPADQLVYCVVKDHPGILPAGIMLELERRTLEASSRDTVNHALARLRSADLALRSASGWFACERKGGMQ